MNMKLIAAENYTLDASTTESDIRMTMWAINSSSIYAGNEKNMRSLKSEPQRFENVSFRNLLSQQKSKFNEMLAKHRFDSPKSTQ